MRNGLLWLPNINHTTLRLRVGSERQIKKSHSRGQQPRYEYFIINSQGSCKRELLVNKGSYSHSRLCVNGYEEARLCETSLTGLLLRLEVVPLLGRDAVQLGVVHLLAHGALCRSAAVSTPHCQWLHHCGLRCGYWLHGSYVGINNVNAPNNVMAVTSYSL